MREKAFPGDGEVWELGESPRERRNTRQTVLPGKHPVSLLTHGPDGRRIAGTWQETVVFELIGICTEELRRGTQGTQVTLELGEPAGFVSGA